VIGRPVCGHPHGPTRLINARFYRIARVECVDGHAVTGMSTRAQRRRPASVTICHPVVVARGESTRNAEYLPLSRYLVSIQSNAELQIMGAPDCRRKGAAHRCAARECRDRVGVLKSLAAADLSRFLIAAMMARITATRARTASCSATVMTSSAAPAGA
jgi:hypothetical protein